MLGLSGTRMGRLSGNRLNCHQSAAEGLGIEYATPPFEGEVSLMPTMPTFRRIKIKATGEPRGMLLADDKIDGALGELRDKLKHPALAILSVESTEPPPIQPPGSRGRAAS